LEEGMTFKVGQKVHHDVYGTGIVLDAWAGKVENYAIRFEKGGPLGWAERSTNDVKDLKPIN
jgi:hypothetical protein